MKPLHCTHCGRRIKEPAGFTDQGAVGPVCALNLGLPRILAATLRKDGLPRAKYVRMFGGLPRPRPVVDESQLSLELEFA